jgi:hypothetical protein
LAKYRVPIPAENRTPIRPTTGSHYTDSAIETLKYTATLCKVSLLTLLIAVENPELSTVLPHYPTLKKINVGLCGHQFGISPSTSERMKLGLYVMAPERNS